MSEAERVIAAGAYDKVSCVVRQGANLPENSGYRVAVQGQKGGFPTRRELAAQLGNDVGAAADVRLVVENRVSEKDHMAG